MFTIAPARRTASSVARTAAPDPIGIALLGLGQVGSAVAAVALDRRPAIPRLMHITGALVRDLRRPRPTSDQVSVTRAGDALLDGAPDVVVEVLGGLEPARGLVLRALERGIPVVTANKSLLAAYGDELFAAAAATNTPLRYEAAVLAGVPFLGTFTRRPLAASLTGLCGVVNGTTNFILTEMRDGSTYPDALAEAQRRGYAEPDPSNDVLGIDAVQKLAVLLRHFARCSIRPQDIETMGIDGLRAQDLRHAAMLGGSIKPVVAADWAAGDLVAFAGPAFVPASHPLARIDGVQNAIVLRGAPGGDLLFAGAGAGPVATAATILDDVFEAVDERRRTRADNGAAGAEEHTRTQPTASAPPVTGWFVRLTGVRLPHGTEVADLFAAHGVWLRRVSDDDHRESRAARCLLAYPCAPARLTAALAALRAAAGCDTYSIRAIEEPG